MLGLLLLQLAGADLRPAKMHAEEAPDALPAVVPAPPVSHAPDIRARAWKVTATGIGMVLVGGGFLGAGRIIDGMSPTDPSLRNMGRAFTVGGVMLMASGLLVGLLSFSMWTWSDSAGTTLVAVGPFGAVGRW